MLLHSLVWDFWKELLCCGCSKLTTYLLFWGLCVPVLSRVVVLQAAAEATQFKSLGNITSFIDLSDFERADACLHTKVIPQSL